MYESFYIQKGVLGMVKVWKDADDVIKTNVGLEEKYKEIKKLWKKLQMELILNLCINLEKILG